MHPICMVQGMVSPHRFRLVSKEANVVAAGCRKAGQVFLHGARSGWRARDLEHWLATHYAAVTVRLDGEEEEASPESGLRPQNVEELVELVGVAITAALRELVTDPSSLIDGVLRAGAVIALENDDGPMWMPVDRPSLDIETRVLSLFATDYLLDPDAYEEELCVCAECEQVSFDAFGQCPTCSTSQSGVRRMSSLLDELEAGTATGIATLSRS